MLVAITGGMCSGKSTLAGFFSELGFEVFDADAFVSRLYRRRSIVSRLKKEFGNGVLRRGRVDKAGLARTVFSDAKKLRRLNSIVHPLVRRAILETRHRKRIVFAEVPLLYESRMERLFDKVIRVRCSRKEAMRRCARLGYTKEEFTRRTAFQVPEWKKLGLPGIVVDSGCSLANLRRKAERISRELRIMLSEGKGP